MTNQNNSVSLEWDQMFDPNGLPPHSPNDQSVTGSPKQNLDPSNDFQSATLTVYIHGAECRFTLRCPDVKTLAQRAEFLAYRYRHIPVEAPPADGEKPYQSVAADDEPPFCEKHGIRFMRHQRGKRRWFSHPVEDDGNPGNTVWCNYRK